MTLSSSAWQELWRVTSATFPACVTMNTFMTCDTCRPVRTAVFISSQFCENEKCSSEKMKEKLKSDSATNLWDGQHRLNVILLYFKFCNQFFPRLLVRLCYFRWWSYVFCLWTVMYIADTPDNSRSIPVLFGVICNLQQPREDFNHSVKVIS